MSDHLYETCASQAYALGWIKKEAEMLISFIREGDEEGIRVMADSLEESIKAPESSWDLRRP